MRGLRCGAHPCRAIVEDPVADIVDARAFENIRRIDCFTQTRRQPAAHGRAGEGSNLVETGAHQRFLAALDVVGRLLVHAVADEFPTGVAHRHRSLRIGVDHARIEAGRGRQLSGGESLQDARQTGAHSVVGPGEIRHIRHGLAAVRRRHDGARHRLIELPVLDIDDEMNKDPLALQSRQCGALAGKLIRYPRVCHPSSLNDSRL